MEREICFISGASNWGGGGQTSVQRLTLPTGNQWARAFIESRRGLHAETAQSALTVIFTLVIGGLTSILLTVLGTGNLQFPFVGHSLVMGKGLASLNEAMSHAVQGDQPISPKGNQS